jgi:Uncharacterized conserved protein
MTREICQFCKRPIPYTCICAALPSKPIELSRARVIVLQHPNEQKRKNASLPLIELCLKGKQSTNHGNDGVCDENGDFSLEIIVGRWLGEGIVDSNVWKLLNDPNEPLFIFFPLVDNALSLEDALLARKHNVQGVIGQDLQPVVSTNNTERTASTTTTTLTTKINLLFIDATWKYAKEMNAKTVQNGGWPQHAVYIRIHPSTDYSDNSFKPLRFDIRTPPSRDHLSTAECIAHALGVVEESNELFNALMKPLEI